MVYHYVYITTNLINGHFYIGKHSSSKIQDNYKGSGKRLQLAFEKYGKENFETEIIMYCANENEAYQFERDVISEVLNDPACYNLVDGGKGFTSDSGKQASLASQDAGWFGFRSLKENQPARYFEIASSGGVLGAAANKENKTGMYGFSYEGRSSWSTNYNSNRTWITNGTTDKRVKKDLPIPDGYYVGRSNLINDSRIGMKCWTNGNINIFAFDSPGSEFHNGMIKETPTAKLPWWNDGNKNKRAILKPGLEFKPGRLKWKAKIVECPHCGKSGGETGMRTHHFNYCKNKGK